MTAQSREWMAKSATLWAVGFTPIAPGTAGTFVAFLFLALTNMHFILFFAVLIAVTVYGAHAAEEASRVLKDKDPSCVVIDEFAGYMVSVALLPQSIGWLIAAFVIFRFFDITKPAPIDTLQEIKGGTGIMADDIMAGIYTNVVLQICRVLI